MVFVIIPDCFFCDVSEFHQFSGRIITFFFHRRCSFLSLIIKKNEKTGKLGIWIV